MRHFGIGPIAPLRLQIKDGFVRRGGSGAPHGCEADEDLGRLGHAFVGDGARIEQDAITGGHVIHARARLRDDADAIRSGYERFRRQGIGERPIENLPHVGEHGRRLHLDAGTARRGPDLRQR